jgi:transcriptional regulator with XRE-family HTH domain
LLIDARRAAGLTQVQLSKRLRRPQSYVSKYERGERRLDVIEFMEVADAVDVDAAAILRNLRK